MRIIRKVEHILIIGFFLLSISTLLIPSVTSSSLQIEVLPPEPVSQQNFTISVFDPTIVNETPYLTDVVIRFQNTNYTITDTHPNRELILPAPQVNVPTSYSIEAFKNGYNKTNTTITIVPDSTNPDHVIITVINDTIVANSYFTLRITDEYNTPIQNATVSIQNQQAEETDGLTNSSGYIRLRAPNQKEIQILAQKQGYEEDTVTLWVETTQDSFIDLLTHPYTPIIIAIFILIGTIIFVSIRNKKRTPNPTNPSINSQKNRNVYSKEDKHQDTLKPNKIDAIQRTPQSHKSNHTHLSSKIEEINISKPHPHKETIHLDTSPKKTTSQKTLKPKHQWFSEKESVEQVEQKVDDLLSKKAMKTKENDWFQGTDSLKNKIDTTLTRKQKKKKSEYT